MGVFQLTLDDTHRIMGLWRWEGLVPFFSHYLPMAPVANGQRKDLWQCRRRLNRPKRFLPSTYPTKRWKSQRARKRQTSPSVLAPACRCAKANRSFQTGFGLKYISDPRVDEVLGEAPEDFSAPRCILRTL